MPKGRYRKPFIKRTKYRINHKISAPEVRIIGEDDKQIGIMSISDALKRARSEDLDLVEIAPKANPPVVKIIDYNKFQYQEAKKLSQQKKASKKSEIKEVRFKLYMEDADYQVKLKKVNKFISQNHQVRITLLFRGRQMAYKNQGFEFFRRIIKDLDDKIKPDPQIKFVGRKLITTLSPA